jgi:electron-transferring-flavoprotein dehydrogenase
MTEVAHESLEVDVLFVGAGPANLAAAYRLAQLVAEHNAKGGETIDPMIVMIEKSNEVGDHILSGAVLDPRALEELIPDFRDGDGPFGTPVADDEVLFLREGGGSMKFPIVPPPLQNHGKYVLSLSELTQWLGAKVMEMGVQIFPGFPGSELLYDDDNRVVGVRTGDKGIDSKGEQKPNFEPGIDIMAKVTVLGEGSRGSLCKEMLARLGMHAEDQSQVYSIGVKEVWEFPKGRLKPGSVVHTMGYPMKNSEYGGSFIYHLDETRLIVGLVVGLDYADPFLDPHERLQRLKEHASIRPMLEGGKLLKYGAASIPSGGYYSMPKLYHDGVLIVGDAASFMNAMRIKGIHLGMKSGMLAAETVLEALIANDFSSKTLSGFAERFESSWAKDELWAARNFHAAFQKGLGGALVHAGLQFVSGGRGLIDPWRAPAGHEHLKTVEEFYGAAYDPSTDGGGEGVTRPTREFDGEVSFDKLTSVYHSDTGHEENQPCHLRVSDLDICHNRCTKEYGNPCQHFCPAGVYEWMVEPDGAQKFQINFSNCVHCKTCDIMDPYQIIDWVTPEGGGGPKFAGM